MADSDRANTIDEASTTTIPREATSITHLFDALRKVFERNEVVSGPGLGREPILLEASKLETWTSIHNALASEDDPSSLGVILREAPQMAKNILDILGSLRESLAECKQESFTFWKQQAQIRDLIRSQYCPFSQGSKRTVLNRLSISMTCR